jgi:multiple sugar transport system substrate-binding protein
LNLYGRDIRTLHGTPFQSETGDPEPDPEIFGDEYEIAWLIWDNRRRLEDTHNVTFSSPVMAWHEIMPALASSVEAGEPIADLVVLSQGAQVFTALMGNLIMSADAFAAPESDLWGANRVLMPAAVFEERVWSFQFARPNHDRMGLGVNLDIIYAMGGENPVALYAQGLWTWEYFRELLALATHGDNAPEHQVGLTGNMEAFIAHLIASNDGMMVDENHNYAFAHPRTMAALEFAYEIFSAGWYGVLPGETWGTGTGWSAGNAAFWPANTGEWGAAAFDFAHAVVPFPVGPNNTRGYTNMVGFPAGVTIPVGVADPEYVFYLFEALQQWRGEAMFYESQLEWVRSVLPTEEDVQRQLVSIGETAKFDLGLVVPEFNWVLGIFARYFYSGDMTPALAVATFRQPYQARLDRAFNPS